jgi:hypothetical protein
MGRDAARSRCAPRRYGGPLRRAEREGGSLGIGAAPRYLEHSRCQVETRHVPRALTQHRRQHAGAAGQVQHLAVRPRAEGLHDPLGELWCAECQGAREGLRLAGELGLDGASVAHWVCEAVCQPRRAEITSVDSGKRPVSCFEYTSLPSATTSKTPLPPSISSASKPSSSFSEAARLVAWGRKFQAPQ